MKVDSQGKVVNLNSDELDGMSAAEFLPAGGEAADAETLDGLDSTRFMGDFAGRNDAMTSEFNSTQFKSVDVHCLGTAKAVDGYAQVYPNTADKPIPVALQIGNDGNPVEMSPTREKRDPEIGDRLTIRLDDGDLDSRRTQIDIELGPTISP